jgi:hypothetical protein
VVAASAGVEAKWVPEAWGIGGLGIYAKEVTKVRWVPGAGGKLLGRGPVGVLARALVGVLADGPVGVLASGPVGVLENGPVGLLAKGVVGVLARGPAAAPAKGEVLCVPDGWVIGGLDRNDLSGLDGGASGLGLDSLRTWGGERGGSDMTCGGE